ncbi:MAG TPA: hypothetical protein VFI29_22170 [Hanamia sp.]|nr:hypothetical protein [Hanamia sp.]
MKTKYALLLILTVAVITIFSCKKNSNNSSDNYNYLQGYWEGAITPSTTNYGMALLIKPDNKCRLYINPTGSTIDTTTGSIAYDETWSVSNNTLHISGQLATGNAGLSQNQSTLSGTMTSGIIGQSANFSLTKQ